MAIEGKESIRAVKLVPKRTPKEQGAIPGWVWQGLVAAALALGAFAWWVWITPL